MKIEWKQVAVAFSLGLLIAAALGRLEAFRHLGHGHGYQKMMARFAKELKLDAEQKPKVEAILAAKRDKLKAMREKARPQFEGLREATSKEIRALLRPDQIAAFEKIEARMKEKIEKRRARMERE